MAEAYSLSPEQTAALTRRVTTLSVATATVLTLIKAAVWLASDSVSILASLADSGLDLVAALGTFFAVRFAVSPPDAEHRYGHGKAEAFAGLFQGGLVFASAALIGEEAIRHFIHPERLVQSGWAMAAMVASTGLTIALVLTQTQVLRRTRSVAVTGDRAHYLADVASNLAALAAIAATTLLGWDGFDALGGLVVALVLLWGAVSVFRKASDELLDHELPEAARARIITLATQDPRLTDVHRLRTRASGPIVHIQMHAQMDPNLSLKAAHHVVVAAEKRVLAEFPSADIIIHADPSGAAEPHGGAFAEAETQLPT